MGKFFDADGNEVTALTQEEADNLAKQKTDELLKQKDEELKKRDEELEKLRTKDLNFKKLRDMTEEERSKLSEEKRMILEQKEETEKRVAELERAVGGARLDREIEALVGDDTEMKEKVKFHFNRISDDPKDAEGYNKKINDAIKLANDGVAPNQVNRAFNVSGYRKSSTNKSYSESEEGSSLANELGLHFVKDGKDKK